MKFNTTLFISSFFSAVIVIKTQDINEAYKNENNFKYKPSQRLEKIEKTLPDGLKEFVKDGKAKETLTNTFLNSMQSKVATDGFAKLNQEWIQTISGHKAPIVIDTLSGNLNKIFTSTEGADMINMIASTIYVLLKKAGEGNIAESGLGRLSSMMFSLLASPEMPSIVDKSGILAIEAVNKPMVTSFIRQYWYEIQKLLRVRDLNNKLNNYFVILSSLMKSLNKQKQKSQITT